MENSRKKFGEWLKDSELQEGFGSPAISSSDWKKINALIGDNEEAGVRNTAKFKEQRIENLKKLGIDTTPTEYSSNIAFKGEHFSEIRFDLRRINVDDAKIEEIKSNLDKVFKGISADIEVLKDSRNLILRFLP